MSAAAAPHGLAYAPDPSSQSVCTIGGNLAFNSGGAHCLKHGMTTNHVLGLRVVLPDGEVVDLGGDSTEHVGPDWTGMFCGCEGLFGIAVEATLRLVPVPEATRTVARRLRLARSGRATRSRRSSARACCRWRWRSWTRSRSRPPKPRSSPATREGEALLIVELEGEREVVERRARRGSRRCCASPARARCAATADPAERALIWKGRKSAFSAVGWLAPDYIVQDGVVPRTRLGEALRGDRPDRARERGIRVANVFHAGDGNLHPLILYDGREPGAVERAEDARRRDPRALRRARRLDHRRARRRGREARVHEADVLRGRPGADARTCAPRSTRGGSPTAARC